MAFDIAALNGLVKRVYSSEAVVEQLNQDATLYTNTPLAPDKPSGSGFYFGIGVAEGQGTHAIYPGDALPVGRIRNVQQAVITPKVVPIVVELSGLQIDAAKSNVDSFASALEDNMTDAKDVIKKELNRMYFGRGTGRLALVNGAVTAGTDIIVDNPGAQYFRQNMYIDIYNGATLQADSRKVTVVNLVTNTITVDVAVTVADNATIYREDVYNAANDKEMSGLDLIIDDTTITATFQGINRSTYPIFQGNVIAAGSVNLTNDLLQRSADRVSVIGSGKVDRIISRHGQRRKYLDLVTAQKRFSTGKMDSGFDTLTWNGTIDWDVDVDCPLGTVFLLTSKDIRRYEITGLHWDDTDGKVIKWVPGFDKFSMYMKVYGNLGSKKPNSHAKLEGLTEPTY